MVISSLQTLKLLVTNFAKDLIFQSLFNHTYRGVSENVVYPIVPNGFADPYPVFKWLAIIGKINPTFSDKSIYNSNGKSPFLMGKYGKIHYKWAIFNSI